MTTRRAFLGGAAAVGAGAALAGPAARADAAPPAAPATGETDLPARADISRAETSTFFATAQIGSYGSLATTSDGDLWPNCWSDDDAIYAANGDGKGFDLSAEFTDTVMNRIDGTPATGITGTRLAAGAELGPVWSDPAKYNRKPTGMVSVGGVLYLAMQDLRLGQGAFDEAPAASISRSDDKGRTWTPTKTPMFPDHRFTTPFFLDFGKDHREAATALGSRDGAYVYAYGLDWNWRDSFTQQVPDPTSLYLGRVPVDAVQDRSRWQFFTGTDRRGRPTWSRDIVEKVPVLTDERRLYHDLRSAAQSAHDLSVISQGGVVWNKPLRRYIYTSWTEYTYEFYEAPTPWGPWRLFLHHDAGAYPWFGVGATAQDPKNGGYGATIPSKFISADGRTMWVQSNWFVGNGGDPAQNTYNFNLRKLTVQPAGTRGVAVPVSKTAKQGHLEYLNDGTTRSEDSFDGTNKSLDWWGYTYPSGRRFSRLDYTTGAMFDDGGWFTPYDGGLRVQVRRDTDWVDVEDLSISPDYPYDRTAGPSKTYSLRFRPVTGDGIRIIGRPGGSAFFTSIAELTVR